MRIKFVIFSTLAVLLIFSWGVGWSSARWLFLLALPLIAVGRIFTAFHIAKNLRFGADMCYSARGFMMSLGCVQSLLPSSCVAQHAAGIKVLDMAASA